MNPPPPRLQTLAEIESAVWRGLGRATVDKHHAWRTPVLATAGADGQVDARTVVLREVQADARMLVVYTDARAAKVAQLQAQAHCTLVMWSPSLGWQLRIRAQAAVHTDGLAVSSRWAGLRSSRAANDYLSPQAPGMPLQDTLPEPTVPPPATARGHFAVVMAQVEQIDWLELHPAGHRRARFAPRAAEWLVP